MTDRDRIARDLHDHVVQRLFAVGLALQGTIPWARSAEVQQQLSECVDDLQQVIQEIRTPIFDLHGPQSGTTRLRQRLDEAVAQFAGDHCVPLCSVSARFLSSMPRRPIMPKRLYAKRSATLSGTPAPPPLSINVNVEDELSIEVIDNGRGISGDITGSGLVKLRERARDAGGSFAIEPAPSGGTVLRWSAPLPGRTFDFVHWDQRPW